MARIFIFIFLKIPDMLGSSPNVSFVQYKRDSLTAKLVVDELGKQIVKSYLFLRRLPCVHGVLRVKQSSLGDPKFHRLLK